MSWGTWIGLDPDKTGVTLEELEHRQKLANIRHSFCAKDKGGWAISRYYSHEGGEVVEYMRIRNNKYHTMTIQINKDYTWKVK